MPPKRGRKKLASKKASVEKLPVKRNCNGEPILAKAGADVEHSVLTPMLRRGRSRKSAPLESSPEDEMKVVPNKRINGPSPSPAKTTPTTRARNKCTVNRRDNIVYSSVKESSVQVENVRGSQNPCSAKTFISTGPRGPSQNHCPDAGSNPPGQLQNQSTTGGSSPGKDLKDRQITAAHHRISESVVKLETLDLDKKQASNICVMVKQISSAGSPSFKSGLTAKASEPEVQQCCIRDDEIGSEHLEQVDYEHSNSIGSTNAERPENLCGKDYLADLAGEEDFEPDYDEDLHIHDHSVTDCTTEKNSTEYDCAPDDCCTVLAELDESTKLTGDCSDKRNTENVFSKSLTLMSDVKHDVIQNEADDQMLASDQKSVLIKHCPPESIKKALDSNTSEQPAGETGSTVVSSVKFVTRKEKDGVQQPSGKEILHEKEQLSNVGHSSVATSSLVESNLVENGPLVCKNSHKLSTERQFSKGSASARTSQDSEVSSVARCERTCTVKLPAWYDKVVSESNLWKKDKNQATANASGFSDGEGQGSDGVKESSSREVSARKSTSVLKRESVVKALGSATSKAKTCSSQVIRSVKPLVDVEIKPNKQFIAATIFDTENMSSVDTGVSEALSDTVNTRRKKAVVKALSRKIAEGNTCLDGQRRQGSTNQKIKCGSNRQMSSSNSNKTVCMHSKKYGVGQQEQYPGNTSTVSNSEKETNKTDDVSEKVKDEEDSRNSYSLPKDANSCDNDVFDVGFDIELETSIDMLKDDEQSCVKNSQFWRVHRGTNTGHVPYDAEVICERIKNSASCPISMSFRTIAIQTCKTGQHEPTAASWVSEMTKRKLSSSCGASIQNVSKVESCMTTGQTVRRPWKRQHGISACTEQGTACKQKRIILKRTKVLPSADQYDAEVGKNCSLSSDESQMHFTCETGDYSSVDDRNQKGTGQATKSSSVDHIHDDSNTRGQRNEPYVGRRQHASNMSAEVVTSDGASDGGNDSQMCSKNNKTICTDDKAEGFKKNTAGTRKKNYAVKMGSRSHLDHEHKIFSSSKDAGLRKNPAQSEGSITGYSQQSAGSVDETHQRGESSVGGSAQKLTKSRSNMWNNDNGKLARSFPGIGFRHSSNESLTLQYSGKDCKAGSRKEYLRKHPMPRGMIQKYDILQPPELDCEQNGILPESRNAIEKCGREGKWEKLAGMLSQLVSLNEKQEIQRCLQHFTSALMNGSKYEMNFIKFLQSLESKRNGVLKNDEKQYIGTIGLMLMTRCLAQKNIQTAFMVLLLLHEKAIPYMYPSLPFIVPTAKVILTAAEICLAVSKPEQIYEIMKMAHWFEKCNLETMIHIRVDAIRDLLLRLLRAAKSSQITNDCCLTVLSVIASCVKKLAMKYKTDQHLYRQYTKYLDFNVLFRELLPLAKEHQHKSLYRAVIKTVATLHSINVHPAEVREMFHFIYNVSRSEQEFYEDALMAMKYGHSLGIYPNTKYNVRNGGLVVLWLVMSREEMHAAMDLYLDSICVTWLNLGGAKSQAGLQLSVRLSEVHPTANIRQAYSHEMGLNIARKDAIDKAMSVFRQDMNPPLEWTEYSDGIFKISPPSLFSILQAKLEQRHKKESLKAVPDGFRVVGKQKTAKNFMKKHQEIMTELWQSVNIGSNGDLELSVEKPSIPLPPASAPFTAMSDAQLQNECNKNTSNVPTFGRSEGQHLTDYRGESLSARMKDIFHSMGSSNKRGEAGIKSHIACDSRDAVAEEKQDMEYVPQCSPLLSDGLIPEFDTYSDSDMRYHDTECYQFSGSLGAQGSGASSGVQQKPSDQQQQLADGVYGYTGGHNQPHDRFGQRMDDYYSPTYECSRPVLSTSNRPLLDLPREPMQHSDHCAYDQTMSSFEPPSVSHWPTAEVAHQQPLLPDPCEDPSYGRMTLQPSFQMHGPPSGQRRFRPFHRTRQR